jgi:4-hydroxy-tetrahydrodipicolinate synthase
MTAHSKLKGAYTALVTPMNADGSVDYGALDALVEAQIKGGIDGLVPCGTTGESATMTGQERYDVIKHVVEKTNGRVPVVAGAGSNSTSVAIEHQKRAVDTGAQYALVVTPYYNKPTPEGLYRHYAALLEAADIPIILYNVPSRTACDMKPDTIARLAKLDGIAAVKEATADLDRVPVIKNSTPDDFILLSGDDGSTCPFVLAGGDGVISVTSNLLPELMVEMVHCAADGNAERAQAIHNQLREIISALFIESNPIPLKTALELQGRFTAHMRLPLCEMEAANRETLAEVMKKGGWL